MHSILRHIAITFIAASSSLASASSLKDLENFLQTTHSGRASFTQVVTSPSREGQASKSKTSSGTFEFLRPNRFRFIYSKPFAQSIVSDGKTLWLHDVDLNQVTSRSLLKSAGSTPATVIAASTDLKDLQADFVLQELPERAGLQWVQASPKVKDGQLQSIQVGLRATSRGTELAVLEIVDAFGQRSSITFSQFEANPPFASSRFEFQAPAGATVTRQ